MLIQCLFQNFFIVKLSAITDSRMHSNIPGKIEVTRHSHYGAHSAQKTVIGLAVALCHNSHVNFSVSKPLHIFIKCPGYINR